MEWDFKGFNEIFGIEFKPWTVTWEHLKTQDQTPSVERLGKHSFPIQGPVNSWAVSRKNGPSGHFLSVEYLHGS